MTTRIQVVFYSMYGHIHTMAQSVADGAREVAGTQVDVFQVPELDCSAAELDPHTKNRLSHRGQALAQLLARLP